LGLHQKGWTEELYIVKRGDTLYGISKSFNVSIGALIKTNFLEGDSLKPKQVLKIPSQKEKDLSRIPLRASNRTSNKISIKQSNRLSGETDSYVVEKGDSLYRISKKIGLSIEEIKKRNNLQTSHLKTGQLLLLPKEESRSGEEVGELTGGDEIAEASLSERENGEPITSNPLGKWSNPEERNLFVRVAKTFIGVPYKLGGSTLRGIDCSAFVKKIYEVFNIELPRTTREQFSIGKKVEKEKLEEGDLVFFERRGNSAHVGIYIGDNQFVHASSYNKEVKVDHLNTPYYSNRFLKGVRIKELERES
jgi:cell wall-associated NlpC family hydrolase